MSLAKPKTNDDGQLPTGWHLLTYWHFTAGRFNCRTSAALPTSQQNAGTRANVYCIGILNHLFFWPELRLASRDGGGASHLQINPVLHQTGGSDIPVYSWSVDCASVRQAASSVATWASFASTAAKESVPSCTRNGGSVLVATVTMAAAPFAGSPSCL